MLTLCCGCSKEGRCRTRLQPGLLGWTTGRGCQGSIGAAGGIADEGKRKGRSYGTIIVDLERHRVVDLLPDRTAATVAGWLRQQPGIEVVARDRSTEYASGIAIGAPNAVQVADRWHLLVNLRQAVERWLVGVHARLRRLPVIPGNERASSPARRHEPFPRRIADAQVGLNNRAQRQARHEEVQRRYAAGEALLAIARAMKLARGTVRKYARASDVPEPATCRPRFSIIDPYLPYLQVRLAEGCADAAALWREVRAQGYSGTATQVRRWLSERRTEPAKTAPHRWRGQMLPPPDPATSPSPLPPARQLSWLLVQPSLSLTPIDAAVVARVEQDTDAATVAKLARAFTARVRACNAKSQISADTAQADLEVWLAEAAASGVRAMETFAAGLKSDVAAIIAALTMPWSNGQTEGQVNRLKLIKRQMFGHASFDLLRRRVLLAA